MKTAINEEFWTSNIYPKIKNLAKTDQDEVINELRDSELVDNNEVTVFLNDLLVDYNQVTKLNCKLCLGSDIHSEGV